jgi:hypothetical protein
MQIADAETSFRRYLDTRGLHIDDGDAVDIILALIDWYEAERAEGTVAIKDDGDQLLFQWGTFGWEGGAAFEVGISRQLIGLDADVSIRELALVFRYPATDETGQLDDDAWWCRGPEDVPGFRTDVTSTDVMALVKRETPAARRLAFGATD